jgi:DNA polymerase IV
VGQLLEPLFPVSKGIRLLGVTLSSLEAGEALRAGQQMLLPI